MQNNWRDRFFFFYTVTSFSDINKQDTTLTSGDNVKKYDLFENNLSLKKIKMRVFYPGNFKIQLGRNVAFNAYFCSTCFIPLFG